MPQVIQYSVVNTLRYGAEGHGTIIVTLVEFHAYFDEHPRCIEAKVVQLAL